jgi:hypothetical protein
MSDDRTGFELAEAIGLVAAARRRVATGGAIDLGSLPERIERICQEVRAMPRETAAGYREILIRLIADLEILGNALFGRRETLHKQLSNFVGPEQSD